MFKQKNFVVRVKSQGDTKMKHQPWTKYGLYEDFTGNYLEPYSFTKTGALELSSFCNKYLKLLGFTNFVDHIKKASPKAQFVETINPFEKYNLGL